LKRKSLVKVHYSNFEAASSRNLDKLNEAIAKENNLGLICNELQQAISLKARIEEENALLNQLTVAAAANNMDSMNALMSQCIELGIDGRPEAIAANGVMKRLFEEAARQAQNDAESAAAAAKQLENLENATKKREITMKEADTKLGLAISSGDLEQVNTVLNDAMQIGLDTSAVKQGQVMNDDCSIIRKFISAFSSFSLFLFD
jgi:16S rRNA U1498 N3-methylase RsmE